MSHRSPARHDGSWWRDADGKPLPEVAPLAALGEGGSFEDPRTGIVHTITRVTELKDRRGRVWTAVECRAPAPKKAGS